MGEGTPLRDPSPIKNIGEGLTINAGYALLGIMMIFIHELQALYVYSLVIDIFVKGIECCGYF